MTWSLETSDGNESAKIKYEILPYVRGRAVDLGCGPWKVYPHMVGVDGQASGANVCMDVTDLWMFADESFDCVYSSHTLEDQDDTLATLREWWRIVKPDGYLVLYLPHKDFYPNVGQPGANPAHVHDFVPADIIAAMREVGGGWDLVECQERNGSNEYSFLCVFRKTPHGFAESWKLPPPAKRAAVLRYGAYGDALLASSILPALKADGYHVTVYTQEAGEEILRSDPHVDRIIVHSEYLTPSGELTLFWAHERQKYDRFVNLVHSVEGQMLPAPHDPAFHWSDEGRRAMWSHVNYLERIHAIAGMPYEPKQKFYPTADEAAWAKAKRAEFNGPVVVLQPHGSTWPKWWPYTERLAALLADRGVHCVVLGDFRGDPPKMPEVYGHFVGMGWTIREAMAFTALADVVVGEESALVNAVAFEPTYKVVLLSHSTHDNLTRDWTNAMSLAADGLPCYPCHRLHGTHHFCTTEKKTQTSGCQAMITPDKVMKVLEQYTPLFQAEAA